MQIRMWSIWMTWKKGSGYKATCRGRRRSLLTILKPIGAWSRQTTPRVPRLRPYVSVPPGNMIVYEATGIEITIGKACWRVWKEKEALVRGNSDHMIINFISMFSSSCICFLTSSSSIQYASPWYSESIHLFHLPSISKCIFITSRPYNMPAGHYGRTGLRRLWLGSACTLHKACGVALLPGPDTVFFLLSCSMLKPMAKHLLAITQALHCRSPGWGTREENVLVRMCATPTSQPTFKR